MKAFGIRVVVALMLFPTAVSAQSNVRQAPGSETSAHAASADLAQASVAQKWFDQLKRLAGTWKGGLTASPAIPQMSGDTVTVTMQVTSMGNAIVHTMSSSRRPDNPLTMLYLDGDRLFLTHYCDSGNRPRMQATFSEDGNTVAFDVVDIAGPTTNGHMNRAVFTLLSNGHVQEWTYVMPNGVHVRVSSELRRLELN